MIAHYKFEKMEEKDWFWQEDSYKLDADSPLAISRSLWDGLAQSEADSRSLFASTPPTRNHSDCARMFAPCDKNDQESGVDVFEENVSHDGSPRLKRRRMLLFSTSRDDVAQYDPGLEDTTMQSVEAQSENCDDHALPSCADFEQFDVPAPPSPNSLWFLRNDESQFNVDDGHEQAADKWMSRCFLDNQDHQQVPAGDVTGMAEVGSCVVNQQECEFDYSQSPSTSFGGSPASGTRSAVQFSNPKSVTPVAYPFNLLKPSRAQGDVTLTDINQRLSMAPPGANRFSVDKRMVQAGNSGLTGKSVVHRTKIHTQGDGCITIMRTRG